MISVWLCLLEEGQAFVLLNGVERLMVVAGPSTGRIPIINCAAGTSAPCRARSPYIAQ